MRVAHNCPSGAITYERHDGAPNESAPDANVIRVRENGPYAVNADIAMHGASLTRATLCRCGQSKNKPYCDNSHIAAKFTATGEPATIDSDPLEFRAGRLAVDPLTDGPLQVMGNIEISAAPATPSPAPKTHASAAAAPLRRSHSATAPTRGSDSGVKQVYIAKCLTRLKQKDI